MPTAKKSKARDVKSGAELARILKRTGVGDLGRVITVSPDDPSMPGLADIRR